MLGGLPDLYTALRGKTEAVTLTVSRGGVTSDIKVPLIPIQHALARQAVTLGGLLITERQALDAEATGLPSLRIEFIKQGAAASRAGFQPWDQLETVGGQRFASVGALHEWLKTRATGERIPVLIRRNIASFDRRIGAEYHRFEVQPLDVRLLKAGD
jgi:hypothetical protein